MEDDCEEIWKDILGYERCYQASNLGRMRSYLTNKPTIKRKKPLILKPILNGNGYFTVYLRHRKPARNRIVHNVILETFVGPRPPLFDGAHLNGVKTDNQLNNLKWCSRKENSSHLKLHGTSLIGSKHKLAILNEEKVLEIRKLYKPDRRTARLLSDRFGVKLRTIRSIIQRHSWKHI